MGRVRRKAPVGDNGEDKENAAAVSAFSKEDLKCARDALLCSINDENSTRPFLNLFGAACSNSNVPSFLKAGFSIREQRQMLQTALQQPDSAKSDFARQFFGSLSILVNLVIERQEFVPESAFEDSSQGDDDAELVPDARSTEGLQFLQYAALCVRVYFTSLAEKSKQKLKVPELFSTIVALHGVLVQIDVAWGSDAVHAQQSIVALCETWWLNNGENREDVIGHALPVLVEAAVVSKSDVKRLYVIRSALEVIELDDADSADFVSMLLRVASSPTCLKSSEGKRFLSYLFSLGPTMLQKLHFSIRAQITGNKKSILQDYGDVYFSAWKDATTEEARVTFETEVLQDLVHSVLHAANPSLVTALLQVLSRYHDAKQNVEVEALLHRLYGPVLWRATAAANAKVRVNAVRVLSKVFPLQQPQQKARNGKHIADSAVLKACAALRKLLLDPDPRVRVASSEAVAHILCVFWDGIPSNEIRRLLNRK
jgi:condensin-2 complex subunit G2